MSLCVLYCKIIYIGVDFLMKDVEKSLEKLEQIERGKRIKNIRENELHMNKTQLAREIGVSSQFLGLVESGKGNLVYKSLKRLRNLSGHSSDYILFGIDDNTISETKKILEQYSEIEINEAMKLLNNIAIFIKNQ